MLLRNSELETLFSLGPMAVATVNDVETKPILLGLKENKKPKSKNCQGRLPMYSMDQRGLVALVVSLAVVEEIRDL